ncbi:MAG: site-2 protease family protein [Actinomycetota bacterium]|nr:site-2 protease family protein [Actinomycetota bacterium]
MNETIRLGKIAGVKVGLNWSLVVILLLITLGLAGGRFPALYPDREPAAYVTAALVAGILFLASILAHEVGHAVVARRNGIEVDGITLWLFGGVARLAGEAQDPGVELRVAGIGPLISIVIAVTAGAAALLLDGVGAPGLVVGVAAWLATINLILAIFNLVPAAPLDGGRILGALLWRYHGDASRARATAARGGRLFGFFLMAVGLVQFVGGAGIAGLWLVLIGWFLVNVARAEEARAEMKSALGDLRVREIMSADPVIVPPDLTVAQLVDDYLFRHRFSAFPIGRDPGSVEGLVTLSHLKRLPADRRARMTLRQLASPVADVAVGPDELVSELVSRLDGDRRALVVEDGRVIGIVSPTDIVRTMELTELRARSGDRALT